MDDLDLYGDDDLLDVDTWDEGDAAADELLGVLGAALRTTGRPPTIGYGEIKPVRHAMEGLGELHVRAVNEGMRGRAGLVTYTPSGEVTMRVLNPQRTNILWQSEIGRSPIPGFAAMTRQQQEDAVRRRVARSLRQPFLPHGVFAPGADLVPRRARGSRSPYRFDDFDGWD